MHSLAIHRADCVTTQQPFHFAGAANAAAYAAKLKSKSTFIEHRNIHRHANSLKHDMSEVVAKHGETTNHQCRNYDLTFLDDEAIVIPNLARVDLLDTMVPFSGKGFMLNPNAVEFVPSHDVNSDMSPGSLQAIFPRRIFPRHGGAVPDCTGSSDSCIHVHCANGD